VVTRGRWASLACLLVCRRTGLVVFKIAPVVRLDAAVRRVMVRLLRKNGRRREQSSSVCSTGDQRPLSGEPGCRTAGCERSLRPAQVATRLREAQDRSAITVRIDAEKSIGLNACADSEVALGEGATAGQSSFSQLKLSENRRKHFSSPTTRHIACNAVVNAFQQYERLASLATAK
jgi:hypothetical protein